MRPVAEISGRSANGRENRPAPPPAGPGAARRPAIILLVLCLVSCGSPNAPKAKLEGSLLTVMALDYDEAILQYSAGQGVVKFMRKRGTAMGDCVTSMGLCDTTLAVTARLEPQPLPDGGMETFIARTYDLTEVLSDGEQRGIVSRDVLDDPRRMFPELRVGRLTLQNVPQQGMGLKAAGDFHCTFENGVEFASGKTVFSSFQAHFP